MTCTYTIHCDNCHILTRVETTMVDVHTFVWSVRNQSQAMIQFLQALGRERARWHTYVAAQISSTSHHRITRPVLPTVQLDSTAVVEMMINAYHGFGSKLCLLDYHLSRFCLLPQETLCYRNPEVFQSYKTITRGYNLLKETLWFMCVKP
jgi:hypothetical protein